MLGKILRVKLFPGALTDRGKKKDEDKSFYHEVGSGKLLLSDFNWFIFQLRC